MENTLELWMLDDEDGKLGTAFNTFADMLKTRAIGELSIEGDAIKLGDYSMKAFFINSFPHVASASEFKDKVFFSSTGSTLWNYVANQSFHSVNFSELNNEYYDEFCGHGDTNWEYTAMIFAQILGAFVRKWGDTDNSLIEKATFVINELTSHNRNSTHYKSPLIDKVGHSAYSIFMDFAMNKII